MHKMNNLILSSVIATFYIIGYNNGNDFNDVKQETDKETAGIFVDIQNMCYFTVDETNEQQIKAHYDRILEQKISGYCLVSLALKNFSEYSHQIGREKSEQAILKSFQLLSGCLKDGEIIGRIHTHYFNLLIFCEAEESSLHKRAQQFHYAVRDKMEALFGKQLFLEMGFFPIIRENVNFYNAQYFADICRTDAHHEFPETNYDMYYVFYNDQKEEFLKYENLVGPAIKNGDFKLFLQPKVDLKTGKVYAAEALMRWIDPERGMIPLSSFLPNLEENGMIRDVDLFLFDQACGYLDKWLNQYGTNISISFNLSRAYFNGPYFMPEYTGVFEKYNIPRSCIQIELLESIVLNELDKLRPLVKNIYNYGFSCAIDDFGSGFSSFDILTNVDLSELKIDRSLFKDASNEKERMLIRHLIDIAHDLKMVTVAEGIETEEYARYLKEIGCDFIQGFYYYRPMPVEEFEKRFILKEEM